MSQAVSIHIGVNDPRPANAYDTRARLEDSEATAWRMTELASQAGFGSMLLLRGQTATVAAVSAALWNVSQLLSGGDTLLVTYSGHGSRVRDQDGDDPDGYDESWSLYDDELLDDTLCGYWRLFRPGVRIVVVSESCFSGGMMRTADEADFSVPDPSAVRPRRMRGEPAWATETFKTVGAGTVQAPEDDGGVRATVLMITASGESRPARGGLFARCVMEVWANGAFSGSYREFYEAVKARVLWENPDQEPQLLMLGARDPAFPLAPAFRPRQEPDGGVVKRDGGGGPRMRGG